jgi:hypothetical protein
MEAGIARAGNLIKSRPEIATQKSESVYVALANQPHKNK